MVSKHQSVGGYVQNQKYETRHDDQQQQRQQQHQQQPKKKKKTTYKTQKSKWKLDYEMIPLDKLFHWYDFVMVARALNTHMHTAYNARD